MKPRSRRPRHPHPGARTGHLGFIDRDAISGLLAPLVDNDEERAFVVRCLLDEGPAHHRGANFVLLKLLEQLLQGAATPSDETRQVPMQLPPHLAEELEDDAEQTYPIDLPLRALDRLAPRDSAAQEAMIAALTDGPPQHALANVAMVALIDSALRQREQGDK